MRISHNQVESIVRLYVERAQGGERKKKVVGEGKKDEVIFSSRVEEARELYARYKELPEVREEMVQSIRELLQRGEYRVGGEEIARKMIQRETVDFLVNRGEVG